MRFSCSTMLATRLFGTLMAGLKTDTKPRAITSIAPHTAGDFTVSSNFCTAAVNPGQSCNFDITFAPTIVGAEPANTIDVTYTGASGTPLQIAVKGTGAAALVATPSTVNETGSFGTFATAFPSITLGNGSASPVTVTSVSNISGAGYALSFSGCTIGFPIPTGGTRSIGLTYTPNVAGTSSTTFTVSYQVGGISQPDITVTLKSTVSAPQATIIPTPLPSTPLNFPGQVINTQSLPLSVIVKDTGTAPLTISSLRITGTNSNDFAFGQQQSNGTPSQYPDILPCSFYGFGNTIQPGQSCTILLTFTPGPPPLPGGSMRQASLTITDNDPTGSQTVLLEGGATAGIVTVSPNNLSFPSTNVGSSVTQSVLVTNASASPVTFTSVSFGTASYSVDASQTLNACSPSKPLSAYTGSCAVYVKFTPQLVGANSDIATIHTSGASPTVTLSGTGMSAVVFVSPTSLTFSAQSIGIPSASQTVTLNNPTASPVTVSGTALAFTGTNASDFSLATNNCTGKIVAAGSSCTVTVIFTPGVTGGTARSATLTISDSSPAASFPVSLIGTAVQPVASLSATTMSFGNSNLGVATAQQTVTLTNTGNATLNITSVVLGGTNSGDFAQVTPSSGTDCRTVGSWAASASCNVAATFTPTVLGSRTATIKVTDNATPATQVINLSGNGTQPGVTLNPTTIPFGNQRLATTTVQSISTLTNSGTGTLTITSVTLTGANPADFALVTPVSGTDCRTVVSLASGGTCMIAVTFTPATLGSLGATVSVVDNASGSPHTVTLTGTGVFPATTLTPSTPINFGNQILNVTSTVQTLTLMNSGTGTLNLASVALGGTNANQFAFATGTTCTNGSTVAAGASCIVNLTFTPTALGSQSATITFTDDASPTIQVVTLSGTGVFPQATLSPSPSIAFGNQRENTTSAAQTLTLTNGRTGTLTLTTVALGGTNAKQFAIATGTNASDFSIVTSGTSCAAGVTVVATANCTWSVKFTPTAIGSRTAPLTFTGDSGATPRSTRSVALTGTGTAPVVMLSLTTVSFPAQALNTTSAPMNGTLTNSGTTALHLASVAITGTNSGDFVIVPGGTTCTNASTIASANGSCTWSVTFTPSAVGTRTATLTFTDDNNGVTGATQTVTLTGITPPAATLTPNTPIAFPAQAVGTASGPSTIMVSNPGGSTLHISSVAISGRNASDFSVATTGTTCTNGTTVAPAASCVINLTFTPTAAGARRPAALTITDDASPTTQTASLSGTAISFSLSVPTPPAPEPAGTAITAMIQLTPGTGGFPNPVTFTASNLPPDTTAAFSQTTVTPGSATIMTTLTLTTRARSGGSSTPAPPSHRPISGGWMVTSLLALLAMVTLRKGLRMQRFAYLPLALLLLSAAIISGCSSTMATGTAAGNYNVTVTATSGSYSQSTPVPVVVK
jgi:Abnormal spindle-like microcephaly-assoc'd, ASPM-SPD-2-Hydin